jgi:D-alanine-D-alanine ligase
MAKQMLRIEIVRSKETALSSMGKVSGLAIVASLQNHYTDVVIVNIGTPADVDALIERAPDLVFLGMNYIYDNSLPTKQLWISDALDSAGIAYTGSMQPAHKLGRSKQLAKQRMIDRGIRTAQFSIAPLKNGPVPEHSSYDFPLFIKPSDKGGGQGVDEYSIVHTLDNLHAKVAKIHEEEKTDALIEQYLPGREFSVAVIADSRTGDLAAMPIELIASQDSNGDRILGHAVKSSNTEQVVEVRDTAERIKLINFALSAFKALGARDYGRIDIRYDKNETPHFLEANLIPSLVGGYGSFPKAYELNLGLTYDDMLLQIVSLAMQRTQKQQLNR